MSEVRVVFAFGAACQLGFFVFSGLPFAAGAAVFFGLLALIPSSRP